jgi:integrase
MKKTAATKTDKAKNNVNIVGSVKVFSYLNGAYPLYRLRWKVGKESFRKDFRNEDAANAEADRINQSISASAGGPDAHERETNPSKTPISVGPVKIYSFFGGAYPSYRLRWKVGKEAFIRDFRKIEVATKEAHRISNSLAFAKKSVRGKSENNLVSFVGPVRVTSYLNGAYPLYRLQWKVGRKAFHRDFRNAEKANAEAHRIADSLAVSDGAATKARGEDIIYFIECQRRLGQTPLHEAVSFYLKFHEHLNSPKVTFDEVAQEMIASAESRKVSDIYISQLKYSKKVWSGWQDGRPIGQWSAEKITEWLRKGSYDEKTKKQTYSDRTQGNLIRCLQSVFIFARKKGYIPKNGDLPTEQVEVPKVRESTPGIFSPEDMMRVLIAADRRALAYFTIMAFGAGRRAEVGRLQAENLSMAENLLIFPIEVTKTGQRRTVDVPPNLKLWLEEFAPKEGPVVPIKDTINISDDRRKAAGIIWRQNALRHSFCSYHLAKYRNASLTSELAGNSVQIIKSKYQALVSRAATDAWFEITPDSVRRFAKEKALDGLITW